jgi:hypothetical protein
MHLNREDGRVRMDSEVAADSHLFVLSSDIGPVQTRKWNNCLKGPQSLQRKLQESS